MSLLNLTAKKLDQFQTQSLISAELDRIVKSTDPLEVVLFGSAARQTMNELSDLDFIVLFETELALKMAKKSYYLTKSSTGTPVDILFLTSEQFALKSQVGGVCFVARQEGMSLFKREFSPGAKV